jgi:AcrR family transcriptional regulator
MRCRTSGHRRRTIAGVAHPSGTPSLREAQRQFTHERLIDAAQEEFAERGYVGARIDDIATRAGATRATFYLHFGKKSDVILELLERGGGDFHPLWDQLAELPRNPSQEQLRAWVDSAAEVWERHATRTRVVVQAVNSDLELAATQDAREQTEIDLLTAAVRHMGWADDAHARLECTLLFAQLARSFHLWSLGGERDERVLDIVAATWWAAFQRADRTAPADETP